MRRDRANTLKSHEIKLSLSSELQSNLSIAARTKSKFVNLSTEFEKVVNERHEYIVTLEVGF